MSSLDRLGRGPLEHLDEGTILRLHGDRNSVRDESPIEKFKRIIKSKVVEIECENSPFQIVHDLMAWRNEVAHAHTDKFASAQICDIETYDIELGSMEKTGWQKFCSEAPLEEIEKHCEEVMEKIHLKVFGNLEWFLAGTINLRTARLDG